jgi:hypothetical protein
MKLPKFKQRNILRLIIVFLLVVSSGTLDARNRSVKKFSIQLTSSLNNAKNLGIGFLVHPFNSNFPVLHFSYESDWFFDDYVTDNQFVTSFGSDFGGIIDLSPVHIIPTFGYLYQSGFNIERYQKTPEFINHAWFFSIAAKWNINQMYLVSSGRLFFDDVVFLDRYKRYIVTFGFGIYIN